MSVDPLADKYPGWNPYNYTLNNPVRLVDPDGRAPQIGGPDDPPLGAVIGGTLRAAVDNIGSFLLKYSNTPQGQVLRMTNSSIRFGVYENSNSDLGVSIGMGIETNTSFIDDVKNLFTSSLDLGSMTPSKSGVAMFAKTPTSASGMGIIKLGSKAWSKAVEALSNLGKGKLNYRVESASDAKELLKQSRGNMNRYKQYSKDKGILYKKGYEIHNKSNLREIDAGNDLQHIKWKDGKSSGHIFYNESK